MPPPQENLEGAADSWDLSPRCRGGDLSAGKAAGRDTGGKRLKETPKETQRDTARNRKKQNQPGRDTNERERRRERNGETERQEETGRERETRDKRNKDKEIPRRQNVPDRNATYLQSNAKPSHSIFSLPSPLGAPRGGGPKGEGAPATHISSTEKVPVPKATPRTATT